MKKYLSRFLILSTIVLLAACQTTAPQADFASMTFKHLPPIQLRVIDIQLVSNFERSTDAPYVTHKFPVSPEKALIQWAEDRLQIAGSRNTARLTITRAEAQEIGLKLDKSFKGLLRNQQSDRYDVYVEARLEILDEHNIRQAIVSARANRSITVAEATSLADRRKIWFNLVEKLMNDFDAAMQKSINRNLQSYLF